jgi:hypothetical protein
LIAGKEKLMSEEKDETQADCAPDVHHMDTARTKNRLRWVSDELVRIERRQIELRSHEADLILHLEQCLKGKQ